MANEPKFIRNYDEAWVEALGGVEKSDGYEADVEGIADPVPILMNLPQEWVRDYELPAIVTRRIAVMPDPSRFLPGFRPQQVSEEDENTILVQTGQTVPVKYLFEVELGTESFGDMNALLAHTLEALPLQGYGTFLTVNGQVQSYKASAMVDKTDYTQEEGRKFCYSYTYVIEGWFGSADCEKIPQILTTESDVEEQG